MVQLPGDPSPVAGDSDADDEQDWENWEDEEDEASCEEAQSLFDTTRLASADAIFEYDSEHHDFNLISYKREKMVSKSGANC